MVWRGSLITYIQGDLLNTSDKIIAHGCNSMGVMGKGVALQIKERFPWAYEAYKNFCLSITPGALGLNIVSKDPNGPLVIINCITQTRYGQKDIRYVSYDAVDRCFQEINQIMRTLGDKSISIPKIGAGLGGGYWPIIEEIINYRLKDFQVNCYSL